MKTHIITTLTLAPLLASGASITDISSSDFFEQDFRNQRVDAPAVVLELDVDLSDYTDPALGALPPGTNTSWNHANSGFIQVSALAGAADIQISSFSEVGNDSLTFGRQIALNGLLAPLSGTLSTVAGASTIQSWNSTATVNADLVAGQLYEVSFNVDSPGGLPVGLLNNMDFTVSGAGLEQEGGGGLEILNVLDLITIGSGADSDTIVYQFRATQDLSSIDFNFAAESIADVSLLAGTEANESVISFSGFSVTAVPEASSALMLMLGGFFGLTRRRR